MNIFGGYADRLQKNKVFLVVYRKVHRIYFIKSIVKITEQTCEYRRALFVVRCLIFSQRYVRPNRLNVIFNVENKA